MRLSLPVFLATSEQPPKCEIEIQESGEALSYKLASVEEFRNLPENAAW